VKIDQNMARRAPNTAQAGVQIRKIPEHYEPAAANERNIRFSIDFNLDGHHAPVGRLFSDERI
jgi:hypothetical protein